MLASDLSMVWGVGPAFQFPTATDDELGAGKWSPGPGFVVFLSDRPLHITTGFLILNLWSFAGDEDRANVNAMTSQPFFNYNLPKGWYLTTSPLITANWEADDDNRWTLPIGGGIGRIFKIGHQAINANIAAYYNVLTPDDVGANCNCAPSGHSYSQHIDPVLGFLFGHIPKMFNSIEDAHLKSMSTFETDEASSQRL